MNKLSTDKRIQIVKALCEGNAVRTTSRMVGVAFNTTIKPFRELGCACLDYQNATLRDLPCKQIQCDEIWIFVYAKARNVPEEHKWEVGYCDV